jgi:AraC family transcriptional regulator
MYYSEHIKNSIDFIENNLTNDLTLLDCAKAANYSEYHFLRIFKMVTSLTPADYIRKRRLTEVAKLVFKDNSISEIAFRYGFNSRENFIRAFLREHGVSPSHYRKSNNSLKLFEPLSLIHEDSDIIPEIVHIPQFELVGCEYETAIGRNLIDIPKFWNRYNCEGISKKLTKNICCDDYGICLIDEKSFNYFIGVKLEYSIHNSNFKKLTIPSATYAVFTTPKADSFSFVSQIHKTWDYIYKIWFISSNFKEGSGYAFEVYNEQSRIYREKIYIPIVEK